MQAETTATATSSGIFNKLWNYECFNSPKRERIATITLLVIFAISLVIAIFGRSNFMGTVAGISGFLGGILILRRILKNREENKQELIKMVSIGEIKMVITGSSSANQKLSAPEHLVSAFGGVQPAHIDLFKTFVPPIDQSSQTIQSISLLAASVPSFCHGSFSNGQEFVMLRFTQTVAGHKNGATNNFLLFTGPKENVQWTAYHATGLDDQWAIKFSVQNTDDLDRLKTIITTGNGQLRKPQSQALWNITKAT